MAASLVDALVAILAAAWVGVAAVAGLFAATGPLGAGRSAVCQGRAALALSSAVATLLAEPYTPYPPPVSEPPPTQPSGYYTLGGFPLPDGFTAQITALYNVGPGFVASPDNPDTGLQEIVVTVYGCGDSWSEQVLKVVGCGPSSCG